MPGNPEICECGSQLFTSVWAVEHKEENKPDKELDPRIGNTRKKMVGFECVECGSIQITREVPESHKKDDKLDMPGAADKDISDTG